MFFSRSEYPLKGSKVIGRELAITRSESPITNSVPTTSPSRPSCPISSATSRTVLITSTWKSPASSATFSGWNPSLHLLASRTTTVSTPFRSVTLVRQTNRLPLWI